VIMKPGSKSKGKGGYKMTGVSRCKHCKFMADSYVPDCVADGICPLDVGDFK
jgi:hypothetical protein